MKIETKEYGVFYKNRKKWTGPTYQELFTKQYIIDEYGSVENFLKEVRKQYRKPVKLLQQTWKEIP